MTSGAFRFAEFVLDPEDRRLTRDGAPVAMNARYLDALALLVGEAGRLVPKDRFMDEVWRGVPVTDEALTQCIRVLRRELGDDAARPRFIATEPRHGYRFIAAVERVAGGPAPADGGRRTPSPAPWRLAAAAGVGGAAAGVLGGIFYGLGAAQPGVGAVSVLLVLAAVSALMGALGGAGVGAGVAAAGLARGRLDAWSLLGGAAGGLVTGGVVKLLGLDAFTLLLGRSPGDITGAAEGALLGAAVGLGAWLALRPGRGGQGRAMAWAGLAGGAAGAAIALTGGRLMGGSLDLLARHFPGSRLTLEPFGALLGESGFGPLTHAVTATLEGALFSACVVGAMRLANGPEKPRADGTWLGGRG